MIKIRLFKLKGKELFMHYESPVIPEVGQSLRIKGHDHYYKVIEVHHVICPERNRLEINLIVS